MEILPIEEENAYDGDGESGTTAEVPKSKISQATSALSSPKASLMLKRGHSQMSRQSIFALLCGNSPTIKKGIIKPDQIGVHLHGDVFRVKDPENRMGLLRLPRLSGPLLLKRTEKYRFWSWRFRQRYCVLRDGALSVYHSCEDFYLREATPIFTISFILLDCQLNTTKDDDTFEISVTDANRRFYFDAAGTGYNRGTWAVRILAHIAHAKEVRAFTPDVDWDAVHKAIVDRANSKRWKTSGEINSLKELEKLPSCMQRFRLSAETDGHLPTRAATSLTTTGSDALIHQGAGSSPSDDETLLPLSAVSSDASPDPPVSDASPDPPASDASPDPPVSDASPDPPVSDASPDPPVSDASPDPPVSDASWRRPPA